MDIRSVARDHVLDSYIYKKMFSRFQENSVSPWCEILPVSYITLRKKRTLANIAKLLPPYIRRKAKMVVRKFYKRVSLLRRNVRRSKVISIRIYASKNTYIYI